MRELIITPKVVNSTLLAPKRIILNITHRLYMTGPKEAAANLLYAFKMPLHCPANIIKSEDGRRIRVSFTT